MLTMLNRRFKDERGFALIMAMAVMIVLGISVTSVIAYTSSNSRASRFTQARENAYTLAEAGLNNAMSVLSASATPLYPSLLPTTTSTYDTGTATWSGTLDDVTPDVSCPQGTAGHVGCWIIKSTGSLRNPSGAANVRKTLTIKVALDPVYSQLLVNPVYDYVFVYGTGAPSGCDFDAQQTSDFESRLYVQGNLCLSNSAVVTNELHVWGTLSSNSPQSGVGKSTAYNTYGVHVKNGCRYSPNGATFYTPCGTTQHVWANPAADSSPRALTPPDVVGSAKGWYRTASPGPYAACKTTSGVLPSNTGSWATAFDGDVPAGSVPDSVHMNRSVPGAFDLTPASGAYSCKTNLGELSWDPSAKDASNNTVPTLTIKGTIFIDGNARISKSTGYLIRVVGVGTIYLSGSFVLGGANVCAAYIFSTGKCDWALPGTGHWDVSKNFLAVVAGVVGGGGQTETPDSTTSIAFKSMAFQGQATAAEKVVVSTSSEFQGPLVEKWLTLGQSLTTYPFGTLTNVPTATPDNNITAVKIGPPTGFGG